MKKNRRSYNTYSPAVTIGIVGGSKRRGYMLKSYDGETVEEIRLRSVVGDDVEAELIASIYAAAEAIGRASDYIPIATSWLIAYQAANRKEP